LLNVAAGLEEFASQYGNQTHNSSNRPISKYCAYELLDGGQIKAGSEHLLEVVFV
jgi:hypothetical protein